MATIFFALAIAQGTNLTIAADPAGSSLPKPPAEIARKQVAAGYSKLPIRFEANAGQTDAQVKFLARAPQYTVFLTSKEAVLALPKSAVVRMKLQGANPRATARVEELHGSVNYFVGT